MNKISPTCNTTTHKRQVTWFEQVLVDCRCEWHEITSEAVLLAHGLPSFQWCECPEAKELNSSCHRVGPNQYTLQTALLKYHKHGSRCEPLREIIQTNFTCNESTQIYRYVCRLLLSYYLPTSATRRFLKYVFLPIKIRL